MSVPLHQLPPFVDSGGVRVVVESPRGSQIKLKLDPERGVMTMSRPLPVGLVYPFDWGFVPGTRAADGDPLDAMVCWDVASFPGVVIVCRPIALLKVEQDSKGSPGRRERNDRVIAVPVNAPRQADLKSDENLPPRLKAELEKFFLDVTAFEKKNAAVIGWADAAAADDLIRSSAGVPVL
jgi:inorganic pyrophosphatase